MSAGFSCDGTYFQVEDGKQLLIDLTRADTYLLKDLDEAEWRSGSVLGP